MRMKPALRCPIWPFPAANAARQPVAGSGFASERPGQRQGLRCRSSAIAFARSGRSVLGRAAFALSIHYPRASNENLPDAFPDCCAPLVTVAGHRRPHLFPFSPARRRAEPNPPLPHVFLQAGIHRIKAEVADSPQERSRGLMLRKSLQANSGMLFVFEDAALHCFWMKNTLIPLTIAFLDDDGTIVTLADMQPHDEASHCPAKPVRYALEMDQGWFKGKGIRNGDRIAGLK